MNPQSFDTWFPRLMRAAAGIVGIGIMVFETVVDHSDRPYLYAAAIGMMGLPLAQTVENLVTKVSSISKSSTTNPEEENGMSPGKKSSRPPKRNG